jgi:hypothetical protein
LERKSGKNQAVSNENSKTKKDQNDKISSPFQTLVKMSSGKNPSTFTLPPELTCHTYFPGKHCDSNFNMWPVYEVLMKACF